MTRDPKAASGGSSVAPRFRSLTLGNGWTWLVNPEHADRLADAMAGIERIESRPACTPIRSSTVRWVGRFRVEGGTDVVIKRFRPRGLLRVLLMNLRGPQWMREWTAAHALLTLGVQTPTPLALGQKRFFGLVSEGAVITLAVPEAVSLREALSLRGEGPFIRREGIVKAIADILQRLHAVGVLHKDLHGENILISHGNGGSPWHLLDLHRLRKGGEPSHRERMWNLAQLLVSLEETLTPVEEEAVVSHYLAGRGEVRSLPTALRTVRDLKEGMTRRHERSRTRRCLVDSSGFKIRRADGLRVLARRDVPLETLPGILGEARSVSERDDSRALKLSPETRVTAQTATATGMTRSLCVKEFPARGVLHALRWSLVPSRARRFWRGWWGLKVRGFRVPEGYLMWEERRVGVLVNCGVVMEMVEDGLGLDRYASVHLAPPLDHRKLAAKRGLIRELADALARMHTKGVFHGDLKAGNILVRDRGDATPEIIFLDLEAVRFKGRVSRGEVALNLAQLDASMPACVGRSDRLRFLCRYGREGVPMDRLRGLAREAHRISMRRRNART